MRGWTSSLFMAIWRGTKPLQSQDNPLTMQPETLKVSGPISEREIVACAVNRFTVLRRSTEPAQATKPQTPLRHPVGWTR